jgi:hypothetical protein
VPAAAVNLLLRKSNIRVPYGDNSIWHNTIGCWVANGMLDKKGKHRCLKTCLRPKPLSYITLREEGGNRTFIR